MTVELLERTKKQLKRNPKLREVCMKSKYIDYLELTEEFEEGLKYLRQYGQKSFNDSNGRWVEIQTSKQPNFFDDKVEVIPHVIEG